MTAAKPAASPRFTTAVEQAPGHRCDDGWLGENSTGAPIPCLTCRPWLHPTGDRYTVLPHADALTEHEFQQRVVKLASDHGWRHFHARNPQRPAPGWPDLALVRRGRLVVAELKTQRGRVSPEQRRWLTDLDLVPNVETYLWRPSDWPLILTTLT